MSLIDDELAKAEADCAESRQQLANTVSALQSRLKPGALVRAAVEEFKEMGGDLVETGADTVRRHPLPAMGIVAAITAFFARKPLKRLFRRQSDT